MSRMIDQIRASKLPSNMMQFAARGALSVPPAESIEILVHLARHNKIFGDLARMTLAGWDEKASLVVAKDPQTPREVLEYFLSPDNLRQNLLPALLENPSVPESNLTKFAVSAMRDSVEKMLKSPRVLASRSVLSTLKTNPYVNKEEVAEITKTLNGGAAVTAATPAPIAVTAQVVAAKGSGSGAAAAPAMAPVAALATATSPVAVAESTSENLAGEEGAAVPDEEVNAYLKDHATEIAAEGEKPFQSIGGVVELLGSDFFPVSQVSEIPAPEAATAPDAKSAEPASSSTAAIKVPVKSEPKRENALQKINSLGVKGRIQLALKGNKEERSLLIRDGTKVVALAVLEAPKLSDGEVEKFASQKNVLEAVLRQIPLKRRFMKNYIVVRNLVANPRTPLDLSLGLMKNLLPQDLKNISGNKEVSETIRKLALKMFKQKAEEANKKK
jgi:hypothetical protein